MESEAEQLQVSEPPAVVAGVSVMVMAAPTELVAVDPATLMTPPVETV